MIYAFYFYVFAVDPARLCRHCASAGFCDVTEDVFIVPSSEVERRARCQQAAVQLLQRKRSFVNLESGSLRRRGYAQLLRLRNEEGTFAALLASTSRLRDAVILREILGGTARFTRDRNKAVASLPWATRSGLAAP
jgi:hypothetical protein